MTKRRKILLAAGLAALGLAVVVPWLLPMSAWLAPVQEAASAELGAPVVIGRLRLAILPLPHLTVHAVDAGSGALRVATVLVHPDLGSLFSAPRRLRSVELREVRATRAGIELLQRAAVRPRAEPAAVIVERLRLSDAQVTLAGGPLPAIDAQLEFAAANQPEKLTLQTRDGKARLDLAIDRSGERVGWKLGLHAADWLLPTVPPMRIKQLDATGRVDADTLSLPVITASLDGGKLTANLELACPKGCKLGGHMVLAQLDIAPALQALRQKPALSGRLDASGPFGAQAATVAGLADGLNATIAFKVADGVLRGFDLASAAQHLLKGGTSGGQTRFDHLSGTAHVAGRTTRLRDLRIGSGVLDAKGNVDVSAARQLSGRVDVELAGTSGLVSVPLNVAGTIVDPRLTPTRGALAGAAVGTVLLPGVGTAVGSSIGDKLGKLFGK